MPGSVMVSKPQVELTQIKAKRGRSAAQWQIVWALKNRGGHPLHITAVRFPHERFKSSERIFEPPIDLNEDGVMEFAQPILCEGEPGLLTENAFAIFYVTWLGVRWRLFVRLKVVVNVNGNPEATTEMITVHKAGFSGVES